MDVFEPERQVIADLTLNLEQNSDLQKQFCLSIFSTALIFRLEDELMYLAYP